MKHLSIRSKLIGGFALVALIAGVIGVTGILGIRKVAEADQVLYKNDTAPLATLSQLGVSLQKSRVTARDFLAARTPEQRAKFKKQFNSTLAELDLAISDYESANTFTPSEKEAFGEFQEARKAQLAFLTQVEEAGSAGKPETGWQILWSPEYRSALQGVTDALDKMQDLKVTGAEKASKANNALATAATWRMTVLNVAGLALAVGAGIWLTRAITGPVQKMVAILDVVADGDLTSHLEMHSHDEIGRMSLALTNTIDRMAKALRGIGSDSRSLAGSAAVLTDVSRKMSTNAAETNSQIGVVSSAAREVSGNLNTVAAATEELAASVKEIARNTEDANTAAQSAKSAVESASSTIVKLGHSSNEIGAVLKLITSIAGQTQLLALNATIEAARAGEAGKGFAVVASEVKELAKTTTNATKEIEEKVGAIQTGSREAEAAMTQIREAIAKVSEIAQTIATAVEEQAATTREISGSVGEAARGSAQVAENTSAVAETAGSTSAGAAQTEEAARELATMAEHLQQLVGQFKTEATAVTAAPEGGSVIVMPSPSARGQGPASLAG